MSPKFTSQILGIAAFVVASASFIQAASITVDTVGVINTNNIAPVFEATGNSLSSTTFAADIATAFSNNTGGVWDFDGAAFGVANGETITLNYGASLANSLVLTYTEGSGANGINQGATGGEPTSGAFLLGLGGNAATRTFVPSVPLLTVGIFNTDRGAADRIPVLTVTYQDNSFASTSGANANDVFFHGLSGTAINPIVSFAISQNNFVRYDDLGFIAIPEPSTYASILGGLAIVGVALRRRRRA